MTTLTMDAGELREWLGEQYRSDLVTPHTGRLISRRVTRLARMIGETREFVIQTAITDAADADAEE